MPGACRAEVEAITIMADVLLPRAS